MRLLGLFMIYPVFAGYAHQLRGATPETIGLALGAYGLTQGVLQIPFGLLSDCIGRKIMITLGLVLFASGSAVAGVAVSITGMILGRVVQGTGAVGSVILAPIADLTREEARTKAMAIVGMAIGLSFVVAIGVGPLVASLIGVPGIFWLTALMAAVGIVITQGLVPAPSRTVRHRDTEAVPALLARVLRDRELMRRDFAIFTLHAILAASFLAVPRLLFDSLHLAAGRDWLVYLPVLVTSAGLMVPAIIFAERRQRMKEVSIAAIVTLAASLLALALAGTIGAAAVLALVGFFTAFNVMEAILPSAVTKIAPAGTEGTATGVYSSSQFLGIFVGGAVGGWALTIGGAAGVFGFALTAALLWLPVTATMRRPGHYASYLVPLRMGEGREPGVLAARFEPLPGVIRLQRTKALSTSRLTARVSTQLSRPESLSVDRVTWLPGRQSVAGESRPRMTLAVWRRWLWALLAGAMMPLTGLYGFVLGERHHTTHSTARAVPGTAPDYLMTNQLGQQVSSKTFRGKVQIVSFLFPYCTTMCPLIAAHLANLENLGLGPAGIENDVQIVFFNLDPANTGPKEMHALLRQYGRKPEDLHWQYLAGSAKNIHRVVTDRLGVGYERVSDSEEGAAHTGNFAVVQPEVANKLADRAHVDYDIVHDDVLEIVDQQGRIRKTYDNADAVDWRELLSAARSLITGSR